ncbi:hypothetical protein GGS23DRAFT_395068 [Durotheca rogersii]|uniref:uncharacterized protein n=1 Tax=Durotheca rogersii TaxID=419775 RepID=UPI00221ECACB|nr:uncharacterized protein GGS23DRAFT_395068 [Durotheca rogersii]KAI5856683.1 hypothetical protein GGS23DRAFT_395068 [Durotheca rogersii]
MRLYISLLLLVGIIVSYAAASAPTFCKCTCFKNSTLIQLGPQGDAPSSFASAIPGSASSPRAEGPPPLRSLSLGKRAASASCTQCTRAFCLSQHLPICKDAEENDVVAMCFQRDSRKDQVIVWGFILGTTGLLGWAAAKRVIEMRDGRKGTSAVRGATRPGAPLGRRGYLPIGRNGA